MNLLSTITITLAAIGGLALSGCQDDRRADVESKAYPFTTCVVGGEKLGSMGPVLTEVKDGQEVKFCCVECRDKFDKMPTRYMDQIKSGVPTPGDPNKSDVRPGKKVD